MANFITVNVLEKDHVKTTNQTAGVAKQLNVAHITDIRSVVRPDIAAANAVIDYKGRQEAFQSQYVVVETATAVKNLTNAPLA